MTANAGSEWADLRALAHGGVQRHEHRHGDSGRRLILRQARHRLAQVRRCARTATARPRDAPPAPACRRGASAVREAASRSATAAARSSCAVDRLGRLTVDADDADFFARVVLRRVAGSVTSDEFSSPSVVLDAAPFSPAECTSSGDAGPDVFGVSSSVSEVGSAIHGDDRRRGHGRIPRRKNIAETSDSNGASARRSRARTLSETRLIPI